MKPPNFEAKTIVKNIYKATNFDEFTKIAIQIFYYQVQNNPIYRRYIQLIGKGNIAPNSIEEIPFFPVEFFKNHNVSCFSGVSDVVFRSSGTTGMAYSQHHVFDKNLYVKSFIEGFHYFYGDVEQYCIFALLPSYLEHGGSSLIFMVNELIKRTNSPESGFFSENFYSLAKKLLDVIKSGKKVILLGV